MTASCVVPRGDVLELLDDVRDALPGEVDDAQDVLDHRDQMIGEATEKAAKTTADAEAEAHRLVSTAHADAEATVTGARAEADRLVQEATAHAEGLVTALATRPPEPSRPARTSTTRCCPARTPKRSGRSRPAGPATRVRSRTAAPSRPGW